MLCMKLARIFHRCRGTEKEKKKRIKERTQREHIIFRYYRGYTHYYYIQYCNAKSRYLFQMRRNRYTFTWEKMYDAENVFSMKIEKKNLFSKNCNDLWKMYTYFETRIKKNLSLL